MILETDFESGNFIGSGEKTVYKILKEYYNLESKSKFDYPEVGIYKQLSIQMLVSRELFDFMGTEQKKSSIDILMILPAIAEPIKIAVRIEGNKGDLKLRKQEAQRQFLLDSNIYTVDIHKRESEEVFKDVINKNSIQEVKNAFKSNFIQWNYRSNQNGN